MHGCVCRRAARASGSDGGLSRALQEPAFRQVQQDLRKDAFRPYPGKRRDAVMDLRCAGPSFAICLSRHLTRKFFCGVSLRQSRRLSFAKADKTKKRPCGSVRRGVFQTIQIHVDPAGARACFCAGRLSESGRPGALPVAQAPFMRTYTLLPPISQLRDTTASPAHSTRPVHPAPPEAPRRQKPQQKNRRRR